jgi:glutathione synthase
MPATFAFIMDPLEKVRIHTDTSFAFMLAAHTRGHRILHVSPQSVTLEHNRVYLKGYMVSVCASEKQHFEKLEAVHVPASTCDALFIRTDPPFNDHYLTVTWMLSFAEEQGVRIINSPKGIRSANEKLYALNFPEACPKTLITSNKQDILAFVQTHQGKAIAKPIDGHGGIGVAVLKQNDSNIHVLLEFLTADFTKPIVIQEYVPEASQGDKRLLVLNGVLKGAVRRVPANDDHRGNLHMGGQAIPCETTPFDHALVERMAPQFKKDGLLFVGLDVIGDKLIEVNVTSPTLVQELRRFGGPDIAEELITGLENNSYA